MHPADINAALIKSGRTQTRIAAILGVDQSLVSSVVHNRLRSHRVAAAIAAAIDRPIDEIWPGKYPNDGRTKLDDAVAAGPSIVTAMRVFHRGRIE